VVNCSVVVVVVVVVPSSHGPGPQSVVAKSFAKHRIEGLEQQQVARVKVQLRRSSCQEPVLQFHAQSPVQCLDCAMIKSKSPGGGGSTCLPLIVKLTRILSIAITILVSRH
jgi:ribosomal protein S27E